MQCAGVRATCKASFWLGATICRGVCDALQCGGRCAHARGMFGGCRHMFIIVGFFEIAALDFQVSSNDDLNVWLSSPTIPDAVSAVKQLVSLGLVCRRIPLQVMAVSAVKQTGFPSA